MPRRQVALAATVLLLCLCWALRALAARVTLLQPGGLARVVVDRFLPAGTPTPVPAPVGVGTGSGSSLGSGSGSGSSLGSTSGSGSGSGSGSIVGAGRAARATQRVTVTERLARLQRQKAITSAQSGRI